ncbi:hypothetical protein QBC39DRAFT_168553 [Podospora conica]|nr:hypothetical protein QBC39DRAFT_168553 [Schizothecium conicum]
MAWMGCEPGSSDRPPPPARRRPSATFLRNPTPPPMWMLTRCCCSWLPPNVGMPRPSVLLALCSLRTAAARLVFHLDRRACFTRRPSARHETDGRPPHDAVDDGLCPSLPLSIVIFQMQQQHHDGLTVCVSWFIYFESSQPVSYQICFGLLFPSSSKRSNLPAVRPAEISHHHLSSLFFSSRRRRLVHASLALPTFATLFPNRDGRHRAMLTNLNFFYPIAPVFPLGRDTSKAETRMAEIRCWICHLPCGSMERHNT